MYDPRMKTLIGIAACLAFGSLVFAQSSATKKSVEGVNTVIKEMTKGRDQVAAALDSLEALGKPGANMSKEYGRFTKSVAALTKSKERVMARVEDMNSRRDAYLASWHKQTKSVNNPEIKALMESRRQQVEQLFDSSKPSREAARNAFGPFLTDLQDIDTMLSVDLSPSGVQSAMTFTQNAVSNGQTVLAGLDASLQALTQVHDQLSPNGK
jgi:DUF2959 family protein